MRARDGELLADLVHHGDRYLAAHGGRGGRGNARFLSNARRAPGFAEQGEYGEEHWLRLEVKLLADAALVGLPQLGEVHADLGGERGEAQDRRLPVHHARAAPRRRALPRPRVRARRHPRPHRGRGGGARASATRSSATSSGRACSCCCSTSPASTSRTPDEQERVLLDELARYRPELLDRPRLVVGSKADVATSSSHDPDGVSRSPRSRVPGSTSSSVASGTLVDEARAEEPEPRAVRRAASGRGGVHRRARRRRRVAGHRAHRGACRRDGRPHQRGGDRRTCRTGCAGWASSARSPRAGAREGDVVRVGPVELEYVEGFT